MSTGAERARFGRRHRGGKRCSATVNYLGKRLERSRSPVLGSGRSEAHPSAFFLGAKNNRPDLSNGDILRHYLQIDPCIVAFIARGVRYLHSIRRIESETMPASSTATAMRKPTQRSAVTNGRKLFVDGDGRGPYARRFRDVFALHLSDLGGSEAVSEAERSIVRRAALLTVELEQLEAAFASKKASDGDLDLYQRAANTLRRLLESVGLERRAKTVPTLQEYLGKASAA